MRMWNFVGAKVTGCSHIRSDMPCQDAFALRLLPGETLIVAIADGAGSSARSDVGAQFAVQAALDKISKIQWPNRFGHWIYRWNPRSRFKLPNSDSF
jgi:serine/threonine protein phosphatase PrpC